MREAMRQIPWPYFQRQQLRHVAEVLFVVGRFRVCVANAQAGGGQVRNLVRQRSENGLGTVGIVCVITAMWLMWSSGGWLKAPTTAITANLDGHCGNRRQLSTEKAAVYRWARQSSLQQTRRETSTT